MEDFETPRLRVRQVDQDEAAEEYCRLFNSASGVRSPRPDGEIMPWTVQDAEMYLWQETRRENSHCLSARTANGKLIGTAALLVPNPDDQQPWIGLLAIGGGLPFDEWAGDFLAGIERQLVADGWEAMFVAPEIDSPLIGFWQAHGYLPQEERLNEDKELVLVHRRQLNP